MLCCLNAILNFFIDIGKFVMCRKYFKNRDYGIYYMFIYH